MLMVDVDVVVFSFLEIWQRWRSGVCYCAGCHKNGSTTWEHEISGS